MKKTVKVIDKKMVLNEMMVRVIAVGMITQIEMQINIIKIETIISKDSSILIKIIRDQIIFQNKIKTIQVDT